VVHFDIEYNFRPISANTEDFSSNTHTTEREVSNKDQQNRRTPSTHSQEKQPDWVGPHSFLQKPQYNGRKGVVGEPYEASLYSTPRPGPTCAQVWNHVQSRPAFVRPVRKPSPTPSPKLTLQ
ncbi:unnamed protein product, partial [Meganyctiphanes norvegica]